MRLTDTTIAIHNPRAWPATATAVAVLLATGSSAKAAPVEPTEILRSDRVANAAAAVAPSGAAVFAATTPHELSTAVARRRDPSGAFGPVETLSRTADPQQPVLAAVGDGFAAAVDILGRTGRTEAALRDTSGPFGAPSGLPGCFTQPGIAGTADGSPVFLCAEVLESEPVTRQVRVYVREAGGFDRGQVLSQTTTDVNLPITVARGGDGTVVAGWVLRGTGATTVEVAVRRPGATRFTASPVVLSASTVAPVSLQALAVSADGTVGALVRTAEGTRLRALRPGGSAWSSSRLLGPPGSSARLVATGAGFAAAIRAQGDGAGIEVSSISTDALADAAQQLAEDTDGLEDVEAAPDGTVAFLYRRELPGLGDDLILRLRSASGDLGPEHPLVRGARGGELAVTPAGEAIAAWVEDLPGGDERLMVGGMGRPPGPPALADPGRPGEPQAPVAPPAPGAPSPAPTTAPAPAPSGPSQADRDGRPAKVTVRAPRRVTARALRRGVTVEIAADEPVSVSVRLARSPRGRALAARTEREVRSRRRVRLRGRARPGVLRLRVIATDAAGNRTVREQKVRLVRR